MLCCVDVQILIDTRFYSIIKNLVPWARSETIGYADVGSYLNPKYEIRNPKQYRMIQIRMIKTRPWRYQLKHYV
jgi:hypothetical protein